MELGIAQCLFQGCAICAFEHGAGCRRCCGGGFGCGFFGLRLWCERGVAVAKEFQSDGVGESGPFAGGAVEEGFIAAQDIAMEQVCADANVEGAVRGAIGSGEEPVEFQVGQVGGGFPVASVFAYFVGWRDASVCGPITQFGEFYGAVDGFL